MCGIAAVARVDGGPLDAGARPLLDRFADVLAHRGPDERELLLDGPVGLAFTRLSLTGPETGSQPLTSDDGDLVLIANGEVYNHRELAAGLPAGTRMRTGSDCEVLLHLYRHKGLDFLDDVRGMFALILWDRRAGQLILARDRFGIKPLYYHRNATRMVLASEIKALFADPATARALDWEKAFTTPSLAAAPYFPEHACTTWFQDVATVPAGTIQRVDLSGGQVREHVYWAFPGAPSSVPETADDFVGKYRELLAGSVRECATADAELGLFLSGGIDSAAVAALAADRLGSLHTFTLLTGATYRNQDAEFGHRVAAKLGLPNHQVVLDTEHVPGVQEWKRLLWLTETPFCGPEVYYKHELHRYAKAARPELRGMLLGAAADEFNGGYTADLAGGGNWADAEAHLRSMRRTGLLHARPGLAPWWAYGNEGLLTDEVVRQFTGAGTDDAYEAYVHWQHRKIQQYNVWHEDRTAAGSGIEARVPFLDHRLVELVCAIPARLRPELLWDKQILRRAMRGLLPEDVVNRPKQPFFHGPGLRHTYRMLVRMLQRDGGALLDEAVAAPGARRFLNADALRERLRRAAADPADPQIEVTLRVLNLGLLAGMAAELPPPVEQMTSAPVPVRVPITDWETQRDEVEHAVGLRREFDRDAVPRRAAGTLLLTRPDEPGRWYLAIDGTVEFVLDDDAPAYRDLLTRIDGISTLGALLDGMGSPPEELSAALSDLVEQGIVTVPGR